MSNSKYASNEERLKAIESLVLDGGLNELKARRLAWEWLQTKVFTRQEFDRLLTIWAQSGSTRY